MAMLVSLTSFAAALGDGYSKVTDITTLSAGDKVVIYCDASSIGVTGWNGSKDAKVAATGWVEYLVEAATNGVYLKDEGANNYIASPGSSNQFKYGTKAVCSVDANGVLKCNNRYLCYNSSGGNYYRMYSSIGSYKPFYVYKVVPVEVDPDATMYTVTVKSADETMGTVSGSGEYAEGSTATLEATPKAGYKFVNWSNGSTDNPLKITVTEDVEVTANFEAIPPMTCAEAAAAANGATVVLNPFDVVAVVKGAGYIYIKDESGVALIFDFNLDDQLKAGDHVEGFVGTSSPYYGLPELKPSVAFADLTVTPGTAPEPTLFTEVPTKADLNKYVKFENVTFTANATFTTSSATNATMVVNGTNVTLRNTFKLAATLSKDKAYNIVGFVAIYNSTIQVYFLSAEEYVAPEPCTLATPVNWDAPIAAEANTDKWYAVNVASAIAAGKDLALTVTNPGTEAVEITIEAYADCPATELIVKSTKTFNAGETKTTTVKYDEYLADQVEVVYLHVVTSGDLTIGTEAIEPCSKATAINWNDPIAAAANLDAWYAVNVESAIAAGKDLALTVSNPSTEAVEVSIEAYADCPATELIVKSTSTINAGASKTTTVKYDEYLADQVKVVYMHVTTKGGEIKVEAETVKFNVTATAENGTVEGAGIYEQGAEATLTATPAEGYEFVNWTSGETVVSTENPYKFTVTADVALVANFQEVVEDPNKVPTNAELWEAFKPYYNQYYLANGKLTTERADQPIEKVTTFAANYMMDIMTDAASEYKWLGDYVAKVTADAGRTIDTEVLWRFGVAAFFNCKAEATSTWNGNADFTEAGKPENWGPYYLAAQTPVEPTTETVYFVNAQGWTGTINAYAWDPANAAWPGVAATKEAEQIGGYDVYSYTAEAGKYANVIFNGTGGQTADLKWTAGKYYVLDGWYTKEEAEAKLAAPIVDEVVYFVNNKKWSKVNAYAWDPANAAWPGVAATKEAEQIGGFDVYSYSAAPGTYQKVIFNDGGSNQTADMVWTAGKYIVNSQWYTKEEAEAALAAPVVTTWTMVGDKALFGTEWDLNNTANDLVKQEDGSWVLTLTNKTLNAKSYEYKAAKDRSWTTTVPGSANAKLTISKAGQYDITFTLNAAATSVTAKATYIPAKYNVTVTAENGTVTGAGEYEEGATATLTATAAEGYEFVNWTVGEEVVSTDNPYSFVVTADVALVANFKEAEPAIEWIEMPLEISNLTTMEMPVEGVTYLQLTGRDDMNDADVMLFLNNYTGEEKAYEVNAESSFMTFGGMELTVMDGSITKSVDPELGDVFAGTVHASVEEDGATMYVEFTLKMYALPAIAIELEDVEITVNEESAIAFFNATWEGSPLQVEVSGFEEVEFKEYPECWLSIGDDVNWVDAAAGPAAIIIEDGVAMLEGEFTSFSTGKTYEVMLTGKLPVKEEPVVEPTYTENNLNTFAFGLESELNDTALVVTYRLNNSNATSVDVVVLKGDKVVATVPGTTTIGVNTVAVPTAILPQGFQLTWKVVVKGTSVEAPTQEAKEYMLYHPSGLDIDNNPENPTFGMLLINEGMHSVKTSTSENPYISKGFGAGIFAFTPSLDLIPNGDQPGYNGGIEFTTGRADGAGTAYAPRRIRISEDGRIFVTSLNTDGNYLWEVNPANMNEWTPVFQGTLNDNKELITADSNFVAAPNNGFDVKGAGENLQLMMYSVNLPGITGAAMSGFRCDEYNLGTAISWATAPSKNWVLGKYAINYTGTQVVYDNEGGIWIASYRGTANDANPGLVHINADGVEDAKLVWSNVRQAGIRFNNDFTKLVVAGNNGAAKKATIYAVSKDENGAPVLTEETVIDMASVGNNLNDFAFDYAGNLYACGNSAEKLIGWAMPYSGVVETPAASKYAFHLGNLLEKTEMTGVVKRALTVGESTVVLTHEADGTANLYNVIDGEAYKVSQEGVIARDPENAGDLLAISDIAVTEDGKLVAINYMQTQSGDDYVDAGYKRGETRVYLWNDLAGDPAILFTSKMSSNWFRSKQGLTMAVKGTSDNMEIFTTGIHATKAWARTSSYRVIDGVYTEPDVNNNDYYHFYDVADAVALETTVGTQYELNVSPLDSMNWILDAELINPVEIIEPETNNVEISTCVALTQDLGKKYQGTSIVTVGEQVLMVAPYATAEGLLAGVKVLDITAGLDAATEVATADLDAAVEATAAATAVAVAENTLTITLVADATLYTLEVVLKEEPNYMTFEDEITNLVIDLENMAIIGGPSTMWQVEVFLGLAEDDNMDGQWSLSPESSVAIMGFDARLIDGYVYDIDVNAPAAKAVLYVEDSGFFYEFKLNMTSTPTEAIVVVVEDATVQIDTIPLFGDQVDYSLKMTANWTYAEDGVTYPVLVEVPVYYPEATEPSEMTCTVTIGGMGDTDPWLGFGEGTLTITTVDGVVTAKGIVANPYTGVAFDVTVSGKLPQGPGLGIDNININAKPVKMIKNGMLIINKGGREFNAQGAIVK